MSELQMVISFVSWVMLAIVRTRAHLMLDAASEFLSGSFARVAKGSASGAATVTDARSWAEERIAAFWNALGSLLETLVKLIDPVLGALASHSTVVIRQLPSSDANRASRAFGALFFLVALAAFLYADAAQGANNISALFVDVTVPSPLRNLVVPLLVASAGSLLMLGVIMFEILGLTNFSIWSEVRGPLKPAAIIVVLATAVTAAVLSVLIALVRYSEEYRNTAEFAQSTILLPLLITTFLLFWGVYGVLVLWVAAVGLVQMFIRIFKGVLELSAAAAPYIGRGTAVFATVTFTVVNLLLRLVAGGFQFLEEGTGPFFKLTSSVVEVVTAPLVIPADYIANKTGLSAATGREVRSPEVETSQREA